MSDFSKKLLGFLTAWPFAYFLLFIIAIIGIIARSPGGDLGPIGGFTFLLLMLVHFLTIFLIIGLQIFYIVNVFKNERVSQDMRVVWILALFFGGLFAMPIYWYLNIWRELPEDHPMYRSLPSADAFSRADSSRWEERTGDPVPPEPHSWR